MKRVTKKESKIARLKANSIIKDLRDHFRPNYIFADRLVGSARWNTIIEDINGMYDLDYQLLLTKKSKNDLDKATNIKQVFFDYLNEKYKKNDKITVQNSTTAITFIDEEHKYSIDFVLIRFFPENKEIIRRNNDNSNITKNSFTWNELPGYNQAYKAIRKLKLEEKTDLIENYILPKKAIEKKKDINDPTLKSSFQIFIEEVNNYVARKRNN